MDRYYFLNSFERKRKKFKKSDRITSVKLEQIIYKGKNPKNLEKSIRTFGKLWTNFPTVFKKKFWLNYENRFEQIFATLKRIYWQFK